LNATTTVTNSEGAIIRVTVLNNQEVFHWNWVVAGLVAAALIAWRVRRIFRRKGPK
jgi:hypothetical protein